MDDDSRYPRSNLASTLPPAALVATVTRGPGEGSSHGEVGGRFLRSLCLPLYAGLARAGNYTILWFKLD